MVLQVLLLLFYYSVLLRILPIRKVITYAGADLKPTDPSKILTAKDQIALNKIHRAAGCFLRRIWRSRKPCLRRSLVINHWCTQHDIPCRLIIGVRKEDDKLESHAWIELAGKPYLEKPEQISLYTPIMEGCFDNEF